MFFCYSGHVQLYLCIQQTQVADTVKQDSVLDPKDEWAVRGTHPTSTTGLYCIWSLKPKVRQYTHILYTENHWDDEHLLYRLQMYLIAKCAEQICQKKKSHFKTINWNLQMLQHTYYSKYCPHSTLRILIVAATVNHSRMTSLFLCLVTGHLEPLNRQKCVSCNGITMETA